MGKKKKNNAESESSPVAATKVENSPRSPKRVFVPCIPFQHGETPMYAFAMKAKELWDLVEINRREENKDEGYQRVLSVARGDKIAKFLNNGNAIPLSILVSFDHARFDAKNNQLIIENRSDAGWVIDGQHRLVGAHLSERNVVYIVIAFVGLSVEQQIFYFVTINREQKGVSSSLYYELLKYMPGSKSESDLLSERASDLARLLREKEGSPFFGRIVSTTSPRKGELSLTNFVRKVAPLIKRKTGRLANESDENRAGIIENVYLALQQMYPSEFEDNQTFYKTLGFGAMMNALPQIIDITISKYGKFSVANIVRILSGMRDFDFEPWKGLSGNSGEELAGEQFVECLLEQTDSKKGVIQLS